jgi:ABC-type transport system involved in cytochrome c biogenesis permease subunit
MSQMRKKYYKILWLLVYVDIETVRIKWINFFEFFLFRYGINVPSCTAVNKMLKFNMERVKIMLSANAMLSEL